MTYEISTAQGKCSGCGRRIGLGDRFYAGIGGRYCSSACYTAHRERKAEDEREPAK